MSNYWATALIIESIEKERRRMADDERRRRPRFDEAGYLGGADPAGGPGGRPGGPERGRRRFSFRGGPISVSVSIGLEPGGWS